MQRLQKIQPQKKNQNKMKKLFIFLFVLILSACQQVDKLDKQMYEAGEDTLPITSIDQLEEIDQQERQSDSSNPSKLLLKASGAEPGWFAEFYNNRLRLIVDYGKDSLLLVDNAFENVTDEKGYTYINLSVSDSKKSKLNIKIENTSCVGASGEKQSRKVTVTLNGKTYKGCGELVN